MKKLNKLQINSEKMMKNEELLALRGGYDGVIKCYSEGWINGCMGYLGEVNGSCSTFGEEQKLCKAGGYTGTYCTEC